MEKFNIQEKFYKFDDMDQRLNELKYSLIRLFNDGDVFKIWFKRSFIFSAAGPVGLSFKVNTN